MTSPLVRAWLAARLPDWADHAYACWRGLLHALGVSTEWDPCEIESRYLIDVPAPAGGVVAAGTEPGGAAAPTVAAPPAFHPDWPLMRVCGRCGAHINEACRTTDGRKTAPHKSRRQQLTQLGREIAQANP